MECNFRVGQKVVCVDATDYGGRDWYGDSLQEGAVYTIRDMTKIHPNMPIYLYFHEVRRGHSPSGFELGYYHTRFRALEARKADISALTALLNPTNHRKDWPDWERKRQKERERAGQR